MNKEIQYLLSGILFGLIAGISPGPLLTLVIAESLKHGKVQGIKVAMAPLVTDIPIILITLFLFSKIAHTEWVLGFISFAGAAFILYLGFESIKVNESMNTTINEAPWSLKKGIMVNLLSPHPYLFWMTVGTPIIFKAYQTSLISVILFMSAFYLFLVGSKITIAYFTDKSRSIFKDKIYIRIIRVLGIILIIFALFFIKEGIQYFRFSE